MALTQISTGMLASGDGTVDLNIDNGTFVVDVSTSRVGIGTSSPRSILDLDGGSETQLRLQTTNSGSAASDGLLISLDSSTNAKAYIWNYENAETIFGTNNAERMRIFSDGDVSIGMTANYAKLNVNGDVRAENSKFLAGREDAANPAFAFHDDSDTGIFNINPNILGFSAAGTERMRIDGATGRVGIGSVAPTDGTLHVQTASAGTVAASTQADDIVIENNAEGGMTIITPDDQSARIRFTSPSTNTDVGGAHIFYRQNINKMNIGTTVSGGKMAILSGAGNETMLLDGSGNVGIGGAPATQLFVKSASNAANVFAIESANAAQRLQFGVNTSNGGSYIFEQKAQALRFGTSDTERMQIDSAGNVRIGGTSSITNPYSQTPFTDVNIDGTWGGVISFKLGGVTKGWVGQRSSGNEDMVIGATTGQELLLYANSAERMRISGYQVRIGGDVTAYTPSLLEISGLAGVDRHNRSLSSGTNSRITGSSQASIMAEGVVSVNTVSAGTILTIPHTSQSNLWRPMMVELMFVTGEYNRATGVLGGYAKCGYSILTALTGFYQFEVGGNVSSVSASGNNLLVSFSTGYTNGLANYEGVCMYYKVMSITPEYFQAWNATLN